MTMCSWFRQPFLSLPKRKLCKGDLHVVSMISRPHTKYRVVGHCTLATCGGRPRFRGCAIVLRVPVANDGHLRELWFRGECCLFASAKWPGLIDRSIDWMFKKRRTTTWLMRTFPSNPTDLLLYHRVDCMSTLHKFERSCASCSGWPEMKYDLSSPKGAL